MKRQSEFVTSYIGPDSQGAGIEPWEQAPHNFL